MKAFKTIMNVLGIIAASLLSPILIAMLVVTPVMSAATSFLSAKNIQTVISSVNFSELISGEMASMESEEIPEIGAGMMDTLMETDMMEDIIELCVDNIFATVDGETRDSEYITNQVKVIMTDNIDEIEAIIEDYMGESFSQYLGDGFEVPENVVNDMAEALVDEYAVTVAEMLPSAEDLGFDAQTLEIISNLRSGTYFWIVFGVAAGLTVLVLLCQVMRFKGFMWLGVDYLVAAVLTLVASVGVKAFNISYLIADVSLGSSLIDTIITMISTKLMIGSGILAAGGIVFIVIFVVGRKCLKKRKAV